MTLSDCPMVSSFVLSPGLARTLYVAHAGEPSSDETAITSATRTDRLQMAPGTVGCCAKSLRKSYVFELSSVSHRV